MKKSIICILCAETITDASKRVMRHDGAFAHYECLVRQVLEQDELVELGQNVPAPVSKQ